MQLKVVDEAPELAAVGVCIRPSGIIAGQTQGSSGQPVAGESAGHRPEPTWQHA